jgi:thymidine kinase
MSLELIFGPMFAGKSSAACQVIRRNKVIHRPTAVITSALDTRYTQEGAIVSHNKESYPATAASELLPFLESPEFKAAACIIIEEAQFFPDLKAFCLEAVDTHGKEVICVGLDGDSERRPFGQLLDLIPFADKVHKLAALCTRCRDGTAAIFSFRKPGGTVGQISVGAEDKYEPLCRRHYLAGKHENAVDAFVHNELTARSDTNDVVLKRFERCVKAFGPKEGPAVYQRILAAAAGQCPSLR